MERAYKYWNDDEIKEALEYLEKGWHVDEIAEELERSYSGVINKLKEVGANIKKEQRRSTRFRSKELNDGEKELIVELYLDDKQAILDIADFFEVPTYQIRKVLNEKGIEIKNGKTTRGLNREEVQKLINSGEYSLNAIAKILKTSHRSLTRFISVNDIDLTKIKPSQRRLWTEEEEKRMFDMIQEGKSFNEIGEKLGRPAANCRTKAYAVGYKVRKADMYKLGDMEMGKDNDVLMRFWTEEEEQRLEQMYASGEMYITDIAKALGRSYHSVQNKLSYMGLFEKYEEMRDKLRTKKLNESLGKEVKEWVKNHNA